MTTTKTPPRSTAMSTDSHSGQATTPTPRTPHRRTTSVEGREMPCITRNSKKLWMISLPHVYFLTIYTQWAARGPIKKWITLWGPPLSPHRGFLLITLHSYPPRWWAEEPSRLRSMWREKTCSSLGSPRSNLWLPRWNRSLPFGTLNNYHPTFLTSNASTPKPSTCLSRTPSKNPIVPSSKVVLTKIAAVCLLS